MYTCTLTFALYHPLRLHRSSHLRSNLQQTTNQSPPLANLSPEAQTALRLAKRGSAIVQATQPSSVLKQDGTPVSAADLAVQALVSAELHNAFPHDGLVAEEDAANIPESHPVWKSADNLAGFPTRPWIRLVDGRRIWTLDPIDGTKGFLSGQGYAIGLALLSGTAPSVASLALPEEGLVLVSDGDPLCLSIHNIATGSQNLKIPPKTKWTLSGASPVGEGALINALSTAFGAAPARLCCGSLVKYAAVARGASRAFVQVVKTPPALWDHAAGVAAVVASGGAVTDEYGVPVRLGVGEGRASVGLGGRAIVSTAAGEQHDEVCSRVRDCLADAARP